MCRAQESLLSTLIQSTLGATYLDFKCRARIRLTIALLSYPRAQRAISIRSWGPLLHTSESRWVWLDLEVWRDVGKPIIKIWKLNQCLLQRRENAVQRTPPRAHSTGADYGIYNVLNWNALKGESSAFQCTTYKSLFCVNFKCDPFILHSMQHSSFHLGSGTI
jgi:hypothetical protein